MEIAIQVDKLNKFFGDKQVVTDLSLTVKKGTILGFLGPNGSGKTTSIRMMCGLVKPTSGSGSCFGYDITAEADKIKNLIAYMPQKFSLYDDLSVLENMNFMAKIYLVNKGRVAELMQQFDLEKYRNHLAKNLSGGWKQRLTIACCLLHNPKLLFLDEPTAGVDPSARGEFWTILHDLAANGTTILVATHYMDEAERCFELAYIFNGVLLAQGNPQQIVDSLDIQSVRVSGHSLSKYSNELKSLPAVSASIMLGQELKLIGQDNKKIEQQLLEFMKNKHESWHIELLKINLEEAFIYFMRQRQ